MKMRRQTKKFPFGDSPFPNRVCAHLGINIYDSYNGMFPHNKPRILIILDLLCYLKEGKKNQ
jgi:hypothetical protein